MTIYLCRVHSHLYASSTNRSVSHRLHAQATQEVCRLSARLTLLALSFCRKEVFRDISQVT